jgi:hypothetical protein
MIITQLDSSVSIMTRPRAGQPGFDSRQRQGIFLFTAAFISALEAHPAYSPKGTGGSFPEVKRTGREDDHSSPYAWSYTFAYTSS